jgi:hypothetical protein
VDSTHGTNGYDFNLITVVIVDEYGEGYPVAWCMSNREDVTLLKNVYNAVKLNMGDINTEWFMSDDAPQFYSSWCSIFGVTPKKLLCTWHVDRAWRENVKKIKSKDLEATVYQNLRILMEENDITKFETLLNATLMNLESPTTEEFKKYFMEYYVKRKKEWAFCYRKGSQINTNMYVEAFHRVFKYNYLSGRVNKRMDKCIHLLMKFAKDKGFERLIKLEKGKLSKRIKMIMVRHRTSLKLSLDNVQETKQESVWIVNSKDATNTYTVKLEQRVCPFKCHIMC